MGACLVQSPAGGAAVDLGAALGHRPSFARLSSTTKRGRGTPSASMDRTLSLAGILLGPAGHCKNGRLNRPVHYSCTYEGNGYSIVGDGCTRAKAALAVPGPERAGDEFKLGGEAASPLPLLFSWKAGGSVQPLRNLPIFCYRNRVLMDPHVLSFTGLGAEPTS